MSEDAVQSLIAVCESGKCTDLTPIQAVTVVAYFAGMQGNRGGGLTGFRVGEETRFGDGFLETKHEVTMEFRFKAGWLSVVAQSLRRYLEEMTKTPAATS